jgi:hypothetical protein
MLVLLMFGQGAMYLSYFALYVLHAEMALGLVEDMLAHGFAGAQGRFSIVLLAGTWGALGVASVIIGVALRRSRPWSWLAAMTLEGAILILSLEAYFLRRANILFYVAMTTTVAIIFLLNQREIQIYYRAYHRDSAPGPFGR